MNKTTPTICVLLLLHAFCPSYAQYSIADFDLDGTLDTWYDSVFVGKNPELLEGSFYELPPRTLDDHPFLGHGQWSEGTVTFRGQTYDGVLMIYDLLNGALVVRNTNLMSDNREFLRINPRQVSTFTLFDARFLWYDDGYRPPSGPGFYRIVHDGKDASLIAMVTKSTRVGYEGMIYDRQEKYFIENREGFAQVKGKRGFYLRYERHKKSIKRFIRTNRLKLKKENYDDYAKLMAFCEQFETSK